MRQPVPGIRPALTPELKQVALQALDAYLHAPSGPDGRTPVEMEAEFDESRVKLIEGTLKPLLVAYFDGAVPLVPFKRQMDGANKQNPLWGFKGIKGQMFFNMLTNLADNKDECNSELKLVLRLPSDEKDAATKLCGFRDYVARVGEGFVEKGGDRRGRPMPGSVPYFVSYFWQRYQNRDVWPVYYTNTVQMLSDMNLWEESGEVGEDYLSFKRLNEILIETYSEASGRLFNLYDVEHVFWFKSGKLTGEPPKTEDVVKATNSHSADQVEPRAKLFAKSVSYAC